MAKIQLLSELREHAQRLCDKAIELRYHCRNRGEYPSGAPLEQRDAQAVLAELVRIEGIVSAMRAQLAACGYDKEGYNVNRDSRLQEPRTPSGR